jgi:hypothetical protein
VGLGVHGEVELHVPALLPVYPLHPSAGFVHLDSGGV